MTATNRFLNTLNNFIFFCFYCLKQNFSFSIQTELFFKELIGKKQILSCSLHNVNCLNTDAACI